ncbi:peptidoglycan-binding domain-containing protein [Streptomyces sp. G5(2025)]|uniref:peptidoglycan-binding domain-containing protein n=1 Tax=Streptomyces sp. G5(2025) TaxID=3406628 RepID=UPI003C167673
MTGHDRHQDGGRRCPECGAPRAVNSSPACGCARRTADTASRTRSAEAAAAEDFDPLRIRPYVSLPDPEAKTPAPDAEDVRSVDGGGGGATEAAEAAFTAHLSPTNPTNGPGHLPTKTPATPPPLPRPPATKAPAPDTEDARGFEGGGAAGAAAHLGPADPASPARSARRRRRRRYVLLGGASAIAAVTAGAVFATGLFSSAADRPTRDRALPGASASAFGDPGKPAPPAAKRAASPTSATPRTPSTTPRDTTPPPAPTRSAPQPSPSPSRSSSSAPPSTGRATGSADATPPREPSTAVPLSQGDRGPEVAELQGRLAQLYLYVGERDGSYTRQVTAAVLRYQWARGLTSDEPGAYGRQTRRSLESETREP